MRKAGRGSRARGAAAGGGGRSSSSGGGGGGSRGRGGRPPRSSPFSNAMRAREDTANDDSSLDDIEPESIESILKQRKRHYKSSLREMDAIESVAKASSSQLTEAQVRIFFFFLLFSSFSCIRIRKTNLSLTHKKFTHKTGILRAQASLVRRRFARTRTHRSETDRGYG